MAEYCVRLEPMGLPGIKPLDAFSGQGDTICFLNREQALDYQALVREELEGEGFQVVEHPDLVDSLWATSKALGKAIAISVYPYWDGLSVRRFPISKWDRDNKVR